MKFTAMGIAYDRSRATTDAEMMALKALYDVSGSFSVQGKIKHAVPG